MIKIKNFFYKLFIENKILLKNSKESIRMLEIGPGNERLSGFETLNIVKTISTDYVCDIRVGTKFKDETFDVVYSSHFLEHIEWFLVDNVLKELYRIIKSGGAVEIWVPDTYKIIKVISDAEEGRINETPDGWLVKNYDNNPFVWACGKLFYGANDSYPSWHKGMFTYGYLKYLLKKNGFVDVDKLDLIDCRKDNHGWINLGIKGIKK